MPKISFLSVLGLALLCGSCVQIAHCSGMEAQRITAQVAINALPAPLRSFLSRHRPAIVEHAVEPGGLWKRDGNFANRDQWHYLKLDAVTSEFTHDERMKAAREFPQSRTAARRLFVQHGVEAGGQLPWELQRLQRELADAFVARDVPAIVELSGHLCHFCADAADPFSATVDNRGRLSGNLVFGELPMGDPLFAHQDVAHRVEWELIRRNADRYYRSIRTPSPEVVLVSRPIPAVLKTMIESLSCVEEVCRADREILDRMQIHTGRSFRARFDEYYQLLDDRCGTRCVDNLQRGAGLAAGLIMGAWEHAEKPDLEKLLRQSRSAAGPSEGKGADAKEGKGSQNQDKKPCEYVASKNSKLFHRADCPHAKRIHKKNLIRFATLKEALDSGRRPCKKCSPDEE